MKVFKFIISISLIILAVNVYGQENEVKISLISGPKGIFLRLDGTEELSKLKIGEKKFAVKRKRLDEANFKTIGSMEAANSEAKINSILSAEDLKEFETGQETKMLDFIKSKPSYQSVSLFGELNPGFLQIWGLGMQDASVDKGHFYIYRVFEIQGNSEMLYAESGVFHNRTNEILKDVKAELSSISGMDSSVRFNWKITIPSLEIPEAVEAKQASLFNSINEKTLKVSKKYYEEIRNFLRTEGKIFSSFPISQFNTHFNVYYRINKEVNWTFHSKRIAGTDSLGNTFITADISCNPEDLVEMKVVPEDNVLNQGTESAIARGIAVSNNQVTLIYGLNSKDSTNAIILDWAKLPEKAYYSGIEISRSYEDEPIKTLAILPASANTFTDLDIYPAGRIFTYYVKPLFIEKQDLRQEIPASAAQSCSKFSKPLPPFNVKVETSNGKPKISWEAAEDKSIHSYHVYRGTSSTQFDLISNSVYKTDFIDSTSNISPRLTYFYKIVAMNLTQDTSDYSVTVPYTPEFAASDMYSPDLIEASAINNQIWLKWADVKLNDDFVEGYQLERQKVGESLFIKLHNGMLQNAIFNDTTALPGIDYNYRVTSVSTNGFLGKYSKISKVNMPTSDADVMPITDIKATNLSKSIRISWPSVETDDIISYIIYKKLPTETNFERIGMVAKGIFEFEDERVENDEIYVFSVTAINAKGKESKIVQKKSIYRETK
ncbi:hypothetical protein EGI26_05960 [Lacihabitans sp. CCS-44]|uniref:fibronectin type III domain-containing protein n=1 Tax=Lacihabitans sp. CCS-44 TaxID=2487331 RepID=UPI0020CCDD26|nr:hypothetical protein [Lacihabitans sp. CCS-44]MCP9754708.1 hypothetical protein [Lacihabitans sp. CCS-44]